jgi:eukaryotic-like serine/threonine-protein kinase
MSAETKVLYEFGNFRCDPWEHLLLCDGRPVSLSPKSFEILVALIQNQGRLLTKDDLMQQVWPDSFVEEANLTVNISALRKVLGETPGGQQYIETVPKRGYRFVAPVTERRDDGKLGLNVQTAEPGPEAARAEVPPTQLKPPWSRRWWLAAGLLLIAILVAVLMSSRHTILSDRDTVVLADIANQTGDPVFDDALRQGLSSQLEQSPFLNLLSDERVAQTLSLMAQPKDIRLTHDLAREVCQRTASAAVLDGAIAQVGTQYLLTLKAVNCTTGDSLGSTEAQAKDKDHVLEALGKVASEIRSQLGESLASVQKYDAPPENVTTRSLEALKAYSLGYQAMFVGSDFAAAIPLFQQATSLDPNFAMAYARMGTCYVNLNETVRGAEKVSKAYALRDRVSEKERLYVDSHYDALVTGNLEAARKVYELWAQIYPRNAPPSGYIYSELGDYDKALAS